MISGHKFEVLNVKNWQLNLKALHKTNCIRFNYYIHSVRANDVKFT